MRLERIRIGALTALALLFLALPTASAQAQQIVDSYFARIGSEDRRNSKGVPLERAAQILQQDRANLHRFGIRHTDDSLDSIFTTPEARSLMERMLIAGSMDPSARADILSAVDPLVRVDIYGSGGRPLFVTVTSATPATSAQQLATSAEPPTAVRPETNRSDQTQGPQPAQTGQAVSGVPSGPLQRSAATTTGTLPGLPPFSEELGCELTLPNVQRYRLRCRGVNGAGVESTKLRSVQAQLALHTLGCDVLIFDGQVTSANGGQCFLDLFGIDQPSLSGRNVINLSLVHSFVRREDMIARLKRTGLILGGPPDPLETAREFIAQVDHPLRDLFVHPTNRAGFMSGQIELERWLASKSGAGGVFTRWADASALEGRTFTIAAPDKPYFLVRFGADTASVSTFVDGQVETYDARYETRNGVECATLSGRYRGECLSIIVMRSGGQGAWDLHGALHYARSGRPLPIVFATATEGRLAWDEAVAAAKAQADQLSIALSSGVALKVLPVKGLMSGMSGIAARIYREAAPLAREGELATRLPFLAYHRAHALVCPSFKIEPTREYQVIGTRLQDFSYIPFQKFEVWETYTADAFPVQTSAYGAFATGMQEILPALLVEVSELLGDRNMSMVDRLTVMDRDFFRWTVFHASLIDRIGCSGPTTDRYEAQLLASFEMRQRL